MKSFPVKLVPQLFVAALALLALSPRLLAASSTWTGSAGSTDWANSADWGGVALASGNSIIFTGTNLSPSTTLTDTLTNSSFNIAGITFTAGSLAYTLTGNAFALTGNILDSGASLETIGNAIGITGTQSITTNSGGGYVNIGGNISGVGGLTGTGSGILVFSGSNNYTGATTIGAGTLQLQANAGNTVGGVSSALSLSSTLTQGVGTTLSLLGNTNNTIFDPASFVVPNTTSAGATFNLAVGNNGSGTGNTLILGNVNQFGGAAFGGTVTYNFSAANGYNLQLGSNAAGTAALNIFNNTQINSNTAGSTLSMPGGIAINFPAAYTIGFGGAGNTTIGTVVPDAVNYALNITKNGSGTLWFNGSTAETSNTSAITVNDGTLKVDLSNMATPTNLLSQFNSLTLGGGTLQIVGKASTATTQTFASTTYTAGQSVITAAPASGSTIPTVNLGALTGVTTAGASIEFVGPATINASGSIAATATITTTTAGASGVFGAFINTSNSTASLVMDGATVGLYDFATTFTTAGVQGTSPYTIIGGSQVPGFYQSTGFSTTTGPYDYSPTGGNNSSSGSAPLVRFNYAGAGTLTTSLASANDTYAFLLTPNVGAHNDTFSGSGFQFGRYTQAAQIFGTIIQNNTLGFFNVSLALGGGREVGSNNGLIQDGAGTVVYSGANSYELSTYLNGGDSVVFADSGFGNPADAGTTPSTAPGVTNLYLNGGTVVGDASFTMDNSGSNKRPVVLLGNGGGLAAAAGDTMTIDGVISGAVGTGPLIIGIPASAANSSIAGLLPGTGAGTANTTGTFATGTVVINAANGYYGGTVIDSGILNINGINAIGGADYGGLTFNGGTLQFASTLTSGSDISVGGAGLTNGGQAVALASGTGTIDTNGNSVTLTQGIGNGGSGSLAVVSSIAGGSLTLSGNNTFTGGLTLTSGNLTLGGANVYTGATTVTSGTLALNVGSSLSNTAISVASGATMTAALSGNSNINIGATGATLTLSGGSLLSLQSADSDILDTLTLNGTGSATGNVLTVGGASSAATLTFDLSSTGADELVVNDGKTTFNTDGGKILVSDLDFGLNSNNPAGTYTLISDPNGGLTVGTGVNSTDFWLGTTALALSGGRNYNLSLVSLSGTAVVLDVVSFNPNFYWTGAGPGLTISGSSSWSNITNFSTDQTGAVAQSGSLSALSNVLETANSASHFSQTLDGTYTINSLSFTGTGTSAASNSIILATGTGGVLTINGANTFTDQNGTVYAAGIGLVVQPGSAAQAISANLNLGNSQTWQINNSPSTPLTVSGNIADGSTADALVKTGTGTLILSGSNTYDGGTTVNAGTLALGANNALLTSGMLTVSGSGTFDLAGHNQTLGVLSNGGVSTGIVTASSGTPTLTINNSSADNFGGAITGSLGVTMTGASTLTLSNSNSYSGLTTASAGTLVASNNYSLGNSSSTTGGLALNPSSGTAAVDFTSSAPSIASLSSTGAGTSSLVLGATNAATTLTVTGAGSGSGTTFAGVISDQTPTYSAGIGNLTLGGGKLTLAGANTFIGSTVISSGTLIVGNTLALQDSTLNYNNQGGILSSGTLTAVTLAGLTGSQNLALTNASSAAVAFTLGNNNVTSAYSGGLTGGGSLTKAGSGTVTLSGPDTYSGATTVSGGTLTLTGSLGSSGSYTGEINSNGGTLNLNGATVYTTGLENNLTAAGYVNMTGNSSVTISGNLAVNAGNTDLGNLVTLTSGTLTANSATVGRGGDNEGAAILTAPTADGANGLYVNGATVNIATTLTIGNASESTSEMRIDSGSVTTGSTVYIYDNNNRLSLLDINGGTFTTNDGGLGVQIGAGGGEWGELLVRGTGVLNTRAVTLGVAGQTGGEDFFEDIGGTTYIGAGGIVELGTGATQSINFGSNAVATAPIIAASANWSSSVPITLGTSSLGVAPTIQTANSVGIAENITLTGGIGATGTSGFIKTGAGTLTLAGAGNYYNGMTTVNAGTLNINSEYALGGGNYGGLTLNGGTLQYAATLLNNTTDPTVLGGLTIGANGGAIDTNGHNISFAFPFASVAGTVTVADTTGTGSLTFNAANTYTANTTINSGAKLILASGASLGATAVTVNGTFLADAGNNGVGAATITLNGGSTLSLVDSSIGSLALGGGLWIGGASSAANINLEISGTTADTITAANALSYGADGGVFNFSVLAGSTAPATGTTYTLISDAGGIGAADFSLSKSIINIGGQNYSLSLSNNSTSEILTVNLASINYYFTGAHSSSWNNITNFATDHTGATPQGGNLNSYSNVFLTADSASNYTSETLDGNYTINSLSFTGTDSAIGNTAAATGSITLASGTATAPLTLNPATAFTDANGNNYAIGTGLVVQVGSAAHTISANIDLGMSQTWEIDSSSASYLTVSGVIADGSTVDSLTKTGAGTLVLSNNNTYDGGTIVNAGTLALGVTNALLTTGTLTVNGGTFDLAGNNQQVAGLSDGGVSTGAITASTGASTLTVANSAPSSYGGVITDNNPTNNGGTPSLALVMQGSSTLTLSGSNNFTGGTTITSGTLVAANDYALGNAASANSNAGLVLNPATSGTAVVDFTSANPTIANLNSAGAGTSLIYLGTTAGSGSATTLNVGNPVGVGYFGGTIADLSGSKATAIGNLNVDNSGYLFLTSANTFTGTTTITGAGSDLFLENALALQDSTLNYNNQGGALTFYLSLASVTLGGLEGAENLALVNGNSNAVALTVGQNGNTTTYSGNLTGGTTLTKTGAGTLNLTGSNTFSGATVVNAGTLSINAGATLNTTSASTAEAGGAELFINGGVLNASALSGLGKTSFGLAVDSGTANFNGGLQTDPSSTVNSDIPIYIGGGVLNASTITLGRGTTVLGTQPTAGVTSQFYINGGAVNVTGAFGIGTLASPNNTSSASARIDAGSLTVGGAVTIGLNNGGRWSVLDINGGAFTSTDTTSGIVLGTTTAGNAEFLIRSGTASVQKVEFGQSGDTATSVLNLNGGTLYVGTGGLVQNYSGTTSAVDLTAGTLAASGAWSSSLAMTLGANPTIQTANASGAAENVTLSGTLSGSGFTKTGAGNLTLTAAETYTGATTVTAGTLIVSGSLNGATSLSATSGGVVELETPNDVSTSAHVTLAGGTLETLASQTQNLSDLTLGHGSSALTLGATGSIIKFADSSADTWTGTLAINDWNGNAADLNGGGSDQIFFGTSADLTQAQLALITFINPTADGASLNGSFSAVQLADGELVAAVPEPGAWAMFAGGLGMLGFWQRSRRSARRAPRSE